MNLISASARPNQIDELTRGIDLPFAALDVDHLAVIAETLASAWSELGRTQAETLLIGSETEVNALMETRLIQMLEEDLLWSQLVRSVTRGRETHSYDGSHLEKRPDISIHLSARTPSFPLVVECKIIDNTNRKGCDLYCEHGLKRFLSGEYSWATREAFMLAYVRDNSTIASGLTPFLATSRSRRPEPYAIEELTVSLGDKSLDLAMSRHGRSFRYLSRKCPSDNPGSINVWHLWLPVSASITLTGPGHKAIFCTQNPKGRRARRPSSN